MTQNHVECVVPAGDICGEAVTWSKDNAFVYWVDINRFVLHRYCTKTKACFTHLFDTPVVAISLTQRNDVLLVATSYELVLLDITTNTRETLDVQLPNAPNVRFNDGRCDALGNFWIGTMANNVGPNGENLDVVEGMGKLYRYSYGQALIEMEAGIGISNTVCWAPDGKTFYFGDTLKNEIRAYPFDKTTGEIGSPRVFFSGFERGLPDGSAMDAKGYLWNCRFGGGCIVRIAPDGTIDQIIEMPVRNITTCAFGGPDLTTLFISTASVNKAPTDRLAGSLFKIETQTKGQSENKFKFS